MKIGIKNNYSKSLFLSKSLIKSSIVFLIISSIYGCAFVRTVTFQSHDDSFSREGSFVKLYLYHSTNDDCSQLPTKEFAPLAIAIPALVTIATNIAESEIQSYLDSKKKEFNASYTSSISFPYFYEVNKKTIKDGFDCIGLKRLVNNGKQLNLTAFIWSAKLSKNKLNTATKLSTSNIVLNKSAARTDESGSLDLTVEVKIDAISDGKTINVADKIMQYQNIKINKPYDFSQVETSWFPSVPVPNDNEINKCKQECELVPVTVSVMVTETGTGGDSYGTLGKEIDDNKKTFNDTVNSLISGALTPASTSSSKTEK